MAVNKGVAPVDFSTPVGKFRLLVGDLEYEELDPPEPGLGSYKYFSDLEIESFLEQGDSQEEAAYLAYMQLATAAAMESKSVKDFDLQVDLTKRSGELRAIANMWRNKADSMVGDIFEVFDTVDPRRYPPELAAQPYCGGSKWL